MTSDPVVDAVVKPLHQCVLSQADRLSDGEGRDSSPTARLFIFFYSGCQVFCIGEVKGADAFVRSSQVNTQTCGSDQFWLGSPEASLVTFNWNVKCCGSMEDGRCHSSNSIQRYRHASGTTLNLEMSFSFLAWMHHFEKLANFSGSLKNNQWHGMASI